MKVVKVFNNNAVLASDDRGLEMVLMGKGVAFAKKTGDIIDENKIVKKFVFDATELNEKLAKLFNEVPVRFIELAVDIVEEANRELNTVLNSAIYIALADHICYAVERFSNNEPIKNALLWEIKKFYPKEYAAAKASLKLIYHETEYFLSDDEAGFIALHFVNAQTKGQQMEQTIAVTKIVDDILQIVKYHFHLDLDEESLNYVRFVTHIRYFARRLFAEEIVEGDNELFYQISERYPQSYKCSLKVKKYIQANYGIEIGNDELVYFMLHINRICSRNN